MLKADRHCAECGVPVPFIKWGSPKENGIVIGDLFLWCSDDCYKRTIAKSEQTETAIRQKQNRLIAERWNKFYEHLPQKESHQDQPEAVAC